MQYRNVDFRKLIHNHKLTEYMMELYKGDIIQVKPLDKTFAK